MNTNLSQITDEQKAMLDLRLDAYEVDKNRGRLASDVADDIRRKLMQIRCRIRQADLS